MSMSTKHKILSISMVILLGTAFAVLIFKPFSDEMLADAVIRTLYSIVILEILYALGIHVFKSTEKNPYIMTLLFVLPAIIVSINNFPWIAYFKGNTTLDITEFSLLYFILSCIAVGIFEELIFRGLVFNFILSYFKNHKNQLLIAMFISSFLFGLLHLLNLFNGSAFIPTLLQVAYSFLMGLLWSAVYILTKNLIYPIILHAAYNFTGLLFPTLGSVIGQFDFWTIWLTIIIGGITGIIYLYLILKKQNREQFDMKKELD